MYPLKFAHILAERLISVAVGEDYVLFRNNLNQLSNSLHTFCLICCFSRLIPHSEGV